MKLTDLVPFVDVADASAAAAFYARLGFSRKWDYAPDEGGPPRVIGVQRDDVRLYLSSLGESASGAKLMLWVTDLDALLAAIGGLPEVETVEHGHFGSRELRVHDPDGNYLVFSSRALLGAQPAERGDGGGG
jgi:catechol 2,3-dioxygenase-like lactoylglutathione lyase family enzyme